MPRKDASSGPISAQAQQDLVSEGIENFELPKSIITKIAKSALPENAKLQKDTVLSLIKGSTVFINYLAATAHDVAVQKQHKSISASDVLKALEIIELGDLAELLQGELQAYRDIAKSDKDNKSKSSKKASAPASVPNVSAKSKGKEKAKEAAFTSAPLKTNPYPSIPPLPPQMEVDQDEEVVEGDEEEQEYEVEDVEEDEDEDEEELEDPMAVEEAELKADMDERDMSADAD